MLILSTKGDRCAARRTKDDIEYNVVHLPLKENVLTLFIGLTDNILGVVHGEWW